MKSKLIIVLVLVAVIVGGYFMFRQKPADVVVPVVTPTDTVTEQTVKVAVIKYDPDGKGKIKIGCGDEVVFVDRKIAPTKAVLRAAMDELMNLYKDKEFYSSESYEKDPGATFVNRAGQGKLQNVVLENGISKLYFTSGSFTSAGTCDDPRISAQVYYTATQFPTVKDIEVYVNGFLVGTGGLTWEYFNQKG